MSKTETLKASVECQSTPRVEKIRTQQQIENLIENTAQNLTALSQELRGILSNHRKQIEQNQKQIQQAHAILKQTADQLAASARRATVTATGIAAAAGLIVGITLALSLPILLHL